MKKKLGGQFFDATFRCDKGGPKVSQGATGIIFVVTRVPK